MSYFKPYIDESGFHYPSYNDILESLIDGCQTIYGSGCYLGNDSQDYELLAQIAQKIYDTYQTCDIVYHSFNPITAFGTALDYIVSINGISRRQGTRSTAVLTLTGVTGTTITNGVVSDGNGYMWDLPESVVIGMSGTATATAICREPGVVAAPASTINHIMTPTAGWIAASNEAPATTGSVAESDSELRGRRAESVSYPSQGLVQGLKGALMSIQDTNRCQVYENDKDVMDANGIPGHSICCVIEGGNDDEIAEAIRVKKSPGCRTYGSTERVLVDEDGEPITICYTRPEYVVIDVAITISRRAGYKGSTPDEIKKAIVSYMDTFAIGNDLSPSILWMIAQQVNADPRMPTFAIESVRAARHRQTLGLTDIDIAYDEVAKARPDTIAITVQP